LRQHLLGIARLTAAICLVSALGACGVNVEGDDPPANSIYEPVGLALHPSGRYLYVVNSNFDLAYRRDRGGSVVVVDTDTMNIVPGGGVQVGTFGGLIQLNSPASGDPTRAYVAVRGDRTVVALELSEDGSQLRCNGEQTSQACVLPTPNEDPFGLSVRSLEFDIDGVSTPVDLVAVSHLLGDSVTAFAIPGDGLAGFTRVTSPLISGGNAIARSPRTNHFYVTGRFESSVVAFRPVFDSDGEIEGLFETGSVDIDRAAPFGGVDSRGIDFNQAGTMAFVANRAPDSLLLVDVGPTDPQTGAGARNVVVDTIQMPASPATVRAVEVEPGRELVYVSIFGQEEVVVVDPVTRTIIQNIALPSEGFDLVADTVLHKRLYVSLFEENTIGYIDLDPSSETFHQFQGVLP
jgi:DNA-binding beta-propeller fold protein YncE